MAKISRFTVHQSGGDREDELGAFVWIGTSFGIKRRGWESSHNNIAWTIRKSVPRAVLCLTYITRCMYNDHRELSHEEFDLNLNSFYNV